jgi:SAM-dependent methyltransferase
LDYLRGDLPCLDDVAATPNFAEYFYHLAWAARKLVALNPKIHYDISSHSYFVGVLSALIPIRYFEYRHVPVDLPGLEAASADICNLPFADASIDSLSCMHTVEHIGLGRYGDPLDYDGDLKAMGELKRVVAVGGHLILVVPIGMPARIEFNAHRVFECDDIVSFFTPEMKLEELSLVSCDDTGKHFLITHAPENQCAVHYALGCFHFIKKELS